MTTRTHRPVSTAATATLAVLALTLGACASGDDSGSEPADATGITESADSDAGDSTEAAGVTLENCGREVTVPEPPQRIVSMYQSSTEILLSLGVEERMVGTATWFDPVLPELEEANARVERLADNNPSLEATLDLEPDFVTSSVTPILSEGGVATREQFEDLGVATYVSPTDCMGKVADDGDGYRTQPYTLDMLYQEVDELAEILDVQQEGEELLADLRGRAAEAESFEVQPGLTAMYWFAGGETPYMAGCCGAPGVISETLGIQNVFDDSDQDWPEVSWEAVADRNPDVIFLADLTRDRMTLESAAAKIAFLESDPVTREMDAVREGRYIVLAGQVMDPSIRNIYELQRIHAELTELGLAGE